MKIKFLFSALFLFLHLCWCQRDISTDRSISTAPFGLAVTTTGEIVKSTGNVHHSSRFRVYANSVSDLIDNNSSTSRDASVSENLSKSKNFPLLNNVLTIANNFAANSIL